jgi:uncharacterized protein YicC (UPF0701 family)
MVTSPFFDPVAGPSERFHPISPICKEEIMVRKTVLLLALGAFFFWTHAASVSADTTSSDVSKETKEAWETFKAYMHDQKDDAVADGNEFLQKADAKIEELELKAADASDDAKAKYEESIQNLKEMRSEAGKKLDELGDASADAWDASKDGFEKAYQDLHDAYNEAAAEFE